MWKVIIGSTYPWKEKKPSINTVSMDFHSWVCFQLGICSGPLQGHTSCPCFRHTVIYSHFLDFKRIKVDWKIHFYNWNQKIRRMRKENEEFPICRRKVQRTFRKEKWQVNNSLLLSQRTMYRFTPLETKRLKRLFWNFKIQIN